MKKSKEQSGKSDKKSDKIIAELEHKLEDAINEKQDIFEKLQRMSADYANYQKRMPKQIADSVSYQKRSIIQSLLPSLDNFSHALAGAGTAKDSEEGLEGVIKGIDLVFQHLLDALKGLGVQQIDAAGQLFDPSQHEAVMQRTEEDKPDGVVLEQFQAGYTLDGQTIRPAKVIVNKHPVASQDSVSESVDGKPSHETGEAGSEE